MLLSIESTSSSCTGSFSGEMALATIEHTVNSSGFFEDRKVYFSPIRAHDSGLYLNEIDTLFCVRCFPQSDPTKTRRHDQNPFAQKPERR